MTPLEEQDFELPEMEMTWHLAIEAASEDLKNTLYSNLQRLRAVALLGSLLQSQLGARSLSSSAGEC